MFKPFVYLAAFERAVGDWLAETVRLGRIVRAHLDKEVDLVVMGAVDWRKWRHHQGTIQHAAELTRPLLVIHGTSDDNVHFANSLGLVQALFRAGKDFELLPVAAKTKRRRMISRWLRCSSITKRFGPQKWRWRCTANSWHSSGSTCASLL